MVALFVLAFVSDSNLVGQLAYINLKWVFGTGISFVIFLPILFFAFFAAYFIRVRRDIRPALVLLVVVLALLILFYSSKFFLQRYSVDDEELLSFESVRALLNETNPYANSITPLLYAHAKDVGFTITTGNGIMGIMGSFPRSSSSPTVPFYLLSFRLRRSTISARTA